MTDDNNQDQQPQVSSSQLWWQNPAIIVPITVALIGVLTSIITNIDKIVLSIDKIVSSLTSNSPPSVGQPPDKDKKFFVIAGRSKYPSDQIKVVKRLQLKVGESFKSRYQNIKQCSLIIDSKEYDLVIASNISEKEAISLTNIAKRDGFQEDTYYQSESDIMFHPSHCKSIIID